MGEFGERKIEIVREENKVVGFVKVNMIVDAYAFFLNLSEKEVAVSFCFFNSGPSFWAVVVF